MLHYFFFLAAFFFAGAFFFALLVAFFLIAMTTSSWASLGKPLRVDYQLSQARTPSHRPPQPHRAEYRGAALQESRDDRRFGKIFLKGHPCVFRGDRRRRMTFTGLTDPAIADRFTLGHCQLTQAFGYQSPPCGGGVAGAVLSIGLLAAIAAVAARSWSGPTA